MQLPVTQIEEAARIQVRKYADPEAVAEYVDAMKGGAIFPPIVVFNEPGTERYVVADGHHRLKAAIKANIEKIDVDLRNGNETDALEFALSCNHDHGLRLKEVDRKRAFSLLMKTPALERKYSTNSAKADLLGISARQLMRIKGEWRESEGGTKQEQKKKQDAKQSAKKKTSKNNSMDGDTCHHTPLPPPPEISPEKTPCPHCKGTGYV